MQVATFIADFLATFRQEYPNLAAVYDRRNAEIEAENLQARAHQTRHQVNRYRCAARGCGLMASSGKAYAVWRQV